MRRRAGPSLAALCLLAVASALVPGASGERRQEGDVIVSLDGEITPLRLPRHHPAPATVTLKGSLRTADGAPLPQARKIEIELAGRGALQTHGLALCPRAQLSASSPAMALRYCGAALVGVGRLNMEIFIPENPPFEFPASLRAFNGRLASGAPVIWLHVYGPNPPSIFVLCFHVTHPRGIFATRFTARLPHEFGSLPHLARFRMSFSGRFSYRGERRSVIAAQCPLPPRFDAGIFPLARLGFTLSGGREIATTIVRGCRAPPPRRPASEHRVRAAGARAARGDLSPLRAALAPAA